MIISDSISSFGAPVVPFDTHALAIYTNNTLEIYLRPITYALKFGMIPVLYGDVVFKNEGVAILSGDEIAWYLGKYLTPSRILFATTVNGVYDKNPSDPSAQMIKVLHLNEIKNVEFSQVKGFDVTGGMKTKLILGLKYFDKNIEEVVIFNGLRDGFVYKALCGQEIEGTKVIV